MTLPALFFPWKAVDTPLKLGWFQMLKNSALNCSFSCSRMGKVLNTAQFHVFSPGPRIKLFPQLPKKPDAGTAKAEVLNHSARLFGPETEPIQSGRVASPPVPVAKPGVRGFPLSIRVIPENVQLPKTAPSGPG